MYEILKRDGLSQEMLEELSYKSRLGISLKKDLHYFNQHDLFEEIEAVSEWYDNCELLFGVALDYRVKSTQSARMKYFRYYPEHQARKVFDDMLGFRSLCDNYEEVMGLKECENIRIADLSHGKASDDGYRGIHAYFQIDNSYYPIEIQYNTYFDRQFNNWLHKYLYKKGYPNHIGQLMRKRYEERDIINERDFQEVLSNVLSCGKEC